MNELDYYLKSSMNHRRTS